VGTVEPLDERAEHLQAGRHVRGGDPTQDVGDVLALPRVQAGQLLRAVQPQLRLGHEDLLGHVLDLRRRLSDVIEFPRRRRVGDGPAAGSARIVPVARQAATADHAGRQHVRRQVPVHRDRGARQVAVERAGDGAGQRLPGDGDHEQDLLARAVGHRAPDVRRCDPGRKANAVLRRGGQKARA